jgi:hypothetical protein
MLLNQIGAKESNLTIMYFSELSVILQFVLSCLRLCYSAAEHMPTSFKAKIRITAVKFHGNDPHGV